jgi:transcriptional regulator with XRE-family HTH domain
MALDRTASQIALGKAIKARREELGLTQEELASEAGLHQRWISNLECGWRNPSLRSLQRLASGLGIRTSELLARGEQSEH